MADAPEQRPVPAPAPKRGRLKRRGAAATLLAGALWLLGYGAGWFGAADDLQRGSEQQRGGGASPSPGERGAAAGPAGLGAVAGDGPAAPAAAGDDAAVTAAPAPGASAARPPQAPSKPGMEPDRFASVRSLVQSQLDAQQLAKAGAALARLRRQVGDDAGQAAALAALEASWTRACAAAEEAIVARLRDGEVLSAADALDLLAGGVSWQPRGALAQLASLGDDWSAAPSLDGLPQPAPLPRKRRVRLQRSEGLEVGAVAAARGGDVTVQLRDDRGQRFPTVAAVRVEPVDSSGSEAVEMGLAAAQAGAPALARLWLLRALLLSEELGERGALLRDALRGP